MIKKSRTIKLTREEVIAIDEIAPATAEAAHPPRGCSAERAQLADENKCPTQTRLTSSGGASTSPQTKVVQDVETNFPPELLARDQWVCWRLEPRNNRPTKVPYSPRTGYRASSTAASSWGSFGQAAALLEVCAELHGLGYVFSKDDPYCGIDFDHCIEPDGGPIAPWAREWVDRMQSYTELSPSGTGLHVFVRGELSGNGRKRDGIEVYDRGRFFTVTGDALPGMPLTVADPGSDLAQLYEFLAPKGKPGLQKKLELRQAVGPELPDEIVIDVISASPRRITFHQLWGGNWKARYGSQSEADLALTGLLAEFIGNNPIQIEIGRASCRERV